MALRRSSRTTVAAVIDNIVTSTSNSNSKSQSPALSLPKHSPTPARMTPEPISQVNKRKREPSLSPEPESDLTDLEETPTVSPGKKPRKPRVPKPEPVYVIPDVEQKTTTFAGRLGYACLNSILRSKKPVAEAVFCSRTCRIDSIKKNGMDFVKELGRKNVEDLLVLIQWNVDNNIFFMRMSSEMFPFASHGEYGYSLEYCSDLLARVGELANKHNHRLTTHPGQFTQLGSPNPKVRASSIKELSYHCEMMERMGIGKDGVMIIHGGGMYNDKESTLERLKNTIRNDLPQVVRDRLVLENDEMCYNAEDLLPVCEELDVPLVFDYHHDSIFPSSIPPAEIIARANAIFARRGIKPKQHLSEPRPGAVTMMERRAHSDRCENLPVDLPDDMDLMIEAKDKEQAVLYLHRMYDLHPVIYASLRPADENPTMETKGRKSAKSVKAKKEKERLAGEGEEGDEDATGSVCSPAKKPVKRRKKDEDATPSPNKRGTVSPKKKSPAKKKKVDSDEEDEAEDSYDEEEVEKPASLVGVRKSTRSRPKKKKGDSDDEYIEDAE